MALGDKYMAKNLILVGLITLLYFQCSEQKSPPVEENMRIAYNVLEDVEADDYEIYSMNLDGSDQRNITNSPGVEWVYYAFEDKIYFASDKDTLSRNFFIYEMDAYGNNMRRVTQFPVVDSWLSSRNQGSEMVVTVKTEQGRAFQLIDTNGNLIKKIFESSVYINDPFFSPNGQSIVFRYRSTGKDELWTMSSDGNNLKQLTYYPEGDTSAARHGYHAGPPFWEPNRDLISYISKQNHNYSIYTIKPDGSDQKMITSNEFNQGWHSWSPDGTLIAFEGYGFSNPNFDIYIMRFDGTQMKRLTRDIRSEQAPVFVMVK